MNSKIRIAMLVAAAGFAAPAFAQDSVSTNTNGGNGLPGDGLSYAATGVQRTSYVVDLQQLTTSWGTHFRIGPILKSNKPADATDSFFGMLWSSNSISQTMLTSHSYASNSYKLWTTPGAGVNPTQNSAAGSIAPAGTSTQFGIGAYETSTEHANPANAADTRNLKAIVNATCNFDPAAPNRIYVTRTHIATNAPAFDPSLTAVQNGERCAFGYGSVDASGNTYFRADNNGTNASVPDRIVGSNIFRVRAFARNTSALNSISNLGGTDAGATDRIVNQHTSTHACPTGSIPSDLAGIPNGRYFGMKFQVTGTDPTNYSSETTPGTGVPGLSCPSPQDTRGNACFSSTVLFPNSIGTEAYILRDTGSGAESGYSLQLQGINAGGVQGARTVLRRPAPNTLQDHAMSYTWPETSANGSLFKGYQGIVAFNGGVQVSVGKDSAGRGLAAAAMYNDAGDAAYNAGNPMTAMAVCRFDPANPTATAQWALAGWCESNLVSGIAVNTGKPILNGPGGTPIGRMCSLFEVTNSVPFGPSCSAPVFDSKGNIWFLTAAELYHTGGPSDFDTVLVRGVYNPTNFSYDLELVLQQGDTFLGLNSNRNYRVTFLELAYVGTGASVNGNYSPGSIGGGSGTQQAWNNMNPATLNQSDSRALGGLVLQAKIVYDVGTGTGADGPDNFFDDPTGASQFPNSRDEAYRAVMYITADVPEAPPCLADFNHDGVVDFFDYLDFVDAFSSNDPSADFNGDTVIDFFDYLDFVDAFSQGC